MAWVPNSPRGSGLLQRAFCPVEGFPLSSSADPVRAIEGLSFENPKSLNTAVATVWIFSGNAAASELGRRGAGRPFLQGFVYDCVFDNGMGVRFEGCTSRVGYHMLCRKSGD